MTDLVPSFSFSTDFDGRGTGSGFTIDGPSFGDGGYAAGPWPVNWPQGGGWWGNDSSGFASGSVSVPKVRLPKPIPAWETIRRVQNPPTYTPQREPSLEARIDWQIGLREKRIAELKSQSARFRAAQLSINLRDQQWVDLIQQAARDSEWARLGMIRSCIDLLFSTLGPLEYLADKLRIDSSDLPPVQSSLGGAGVALGTLINDALAGVQSPALKQILQGLRKDFLAGFLATEIGLGSGRGADFCTGVKGIVEWLSKGTSAVDEEVNADPRERGLAVLKIGGDVLADLVKGRLEKALAQLGAQATVRVLALAEWGGNYACESIRYYKDYALARELNGCVQSDVKALSVISSRIAANTAETRQLQSQRATLMTYRTNPAASQAAFRQLVETQGDTSRQAAKQFFDAVELWGSKPSR